MNRFFTTFGQMFGKVRISAVAKGGSARSAILLSSGTAIALAVTLLLSPVIARIYSPASIGTVALFTSFLSMAASAVSLRYEIGIISANDEPDAARLAFLAAFFCLPISVLSSVVLFVMKRYSMFGFGLLPGYAPLLMFPVLLLTGIFGVLRYWEIRVGQFKTISQSVIMQHGVRSGSQIVLGLLHSSAAGLLFGEALGRCGGLSPMLREAFPVVKPHILRSKVSEFRETLRKHRKFPLYTLPSESVETVAVNMVVPLIVLLYGVEAGGYFALVQRVMAVPIYLVTANVADVFHSRFAACLRDHPEDCSSLFRDTALVLGAIGIIPAAILMFFSESTFTLVFGTRWAMAGVMAGTVAPWFLAQFIVSPLTRAVPVLSGQEFQLIYDFFKVGCVAAVFWSARHYGFAELQTVRWLSFASVLSYFVYYLILVYLLRKNLRAAVRPATAREGTTAEIPPALVRTDNYPIVHSSAEVRAHSQQSSATD